MQVHQVYTKFLPIFEITKSKFFFSSDKKGPRYGPSKLCSFCRYTCGIQQIFPRFLKSLSFNGPPCPSFFSSDQKWLRYRPSKLCSFCWYKVIIFTVHSGKKVDKIYAKIDLNTYFVFMQSMHRASGEYFSTLVPKMAKLVFLFAAQWSKGGQKLCKKLFYHFVFM